MPKLFLVVVLCVNEHVYGHKLLFILTELLV